MQLGVSPPPVRFGELIPGMPFRFETLVEESPAGMYVVQDGRMVYANRRMGEIFGCTVDELLALPSVLVLVSEADRPRVEEMIRRRLVGEVDAVRYAWRGVRRDGSSVELEVLARRDEVDGRPAVSGTMIDVTDQRQQARELEERETRLRTLVELTQDVVVTCDPAGRILTLNPSGERLIGSAVGRNVREFTIPAFAERALELHRTVMGQRRDGTYEVPVVSRTGEIMTLEVSVHLVTRGDETVEVVGIGRDITARKQKEEALRSLTLVDDLTRLYNRRGFLTLAERHLKLAMRKKKGVFLLFCDVDGLKQINDTYGHLEGDRALSDAADVLRRTFRSADIIARLGGDEFTVFPLEADDTSTELLTERLTTALDGHNAQSRRPWRLRMSVGFAHFDPESPWTIETLLEEADRRLYENKRKRQTS
jgi:diguanylate cyclase (GGDEF)-like protein/PAS domain S-box-containing protein